MKEFPIIPCNLCGSQENLQRQVVKEMLQEWERKSPGRTEIMFRALQNVVPSQLADRNLFDLKPAHRRQRHAALRRCDEPVGRASGFRRRGLFSPPSSFTASPRWAEPAQRAFRHAG